MNSKIWKSLCECLKRNTTIQPSHHDEDSDVLALAVIELFSDRHAVNPLTEGFNTPQQYGRVGRSNRPAGVVTDFADQEKEYRTVPFDSTQSPVPAGDGWALHSSTWVRDTPRFDCHKWPDCGCPDGTTATDCPGARRAGADDEWRDATAADVGKEFLVKTATGRVTIGKVLRDDDAGCFFVAIAVPIGVTIRKVLREHSVKIRSIPS